MLLVSIFSHSQFLGLIDVMGEPVFKLWAPDLGLQILFFSCAAFTSVCLLGTAWFLLKFK